MLNLTSLFTKFIAIILFAISFITPASPGNVEISVQVNEDVPQTICVYWNNKTNKAITEPRYFIEKLENGQWTEVPFADGFGFPEIYSQYYPAEGGKITITSQRDLKEPLKSGTYRITLYYELLYSETKNGKAVCDFDIE